MEFYSYLEKNWSGQNWSSWTASDGPTLVFNLFVVGIGDGRMR